MISLSTAPLHMVDIICEVLEYEQTCCTVMPGCGYGAGLVVRQDLAIACESVSPCVKFH